jgi:hypothetical protein
MGTRFAIGDKAWLAQCQWAAVNKTCPTCHGKLAVTLVLGNGDEVALPCGGCSPGYGEPTGKITEYDYSVEPELVEITGMSIERDGEKETVEYKSGNSSFNRVFKDHSIFPTEGEARAKGAEMKAKLEEEQRTRAEAIKANVHKSFAWNAHYHMQEAESHRKAAAYHEGKARLCKERAKAG